MSRSAVFVSDEATNDVDRITERILPTGPFHPFKLNGTETAPSSSQETAPSSSGETTPSSPWLDNETVIKKAKATIAAKMSDPNSVEFEGMERAGRKNALGNSIDTICGFVRDKNSGPRQFLYVVEKDEAYIGGYAIATSAYRNICSIATLPER